MSFLYPAFLLGALGIAAPIWLHLRRRHRTNVVRFSALRFLDDQPSPRDMPLHLRHLLFLLLRLLAFLAIIAAFAWPFHSETVGSAESEVRIYLLDNTLSHQVGDGFKKARREIARQIRQAGPQVQTAVIEIASRSRIISDLGASREEAAAAVEALEPTHQRGSYLDAFRLAAALLDRSLGVRRTIFVYGDRQRNQWEENANVPPFLKDVDVVLSEAPGANGEGNVYAGNTRVLRIPQREGSLIALSADLGGQPVNRQSEVSIRAGDKEVLRQALALDGGVRAVQAGWPADSDGWLRGEVEIEGQPDVLPLDNRGYFAVPPLEPGKVALLSRSRYLRASLDPEIARGIWDVTIPDPAAIRQAAEADQPTYDAVVVDSDYLQSKDARDLVLKHLNNGRGILLFITRTNPLVEGFLRSIGFQPAGVHTLAGDQQAFRYADLNHPVLNPFTRPDFGDLLAIRLARYTKLDADRAQGLLFADTGDPILFETRGTTGKMLVFGFGADAESSNWPLRPDFLPFLDQCLRYVRALPDLQISVEPGETYFRKFDRAAGQTFTLAKDKIEQLRAHADEVGRLQFIMPDEPGIYELRREEAPGRSVLETLLSVSTPVKESQLDYIQGRPPVLDAWLLPAQPKAGPIAQEVPPSLAQLRLAQHWWWICLLIGSLLLSAEMAWQTRRSLA